MVLFWWKVSVIKATASPCKNYRETNKYLKLAMIPFPLSPLQGLVNLPNFEDSSITANLSMNTETVIRSNSALLSDTDTAIANYGYMLENYYRNLENCKINLDNFLESHFINKFSCQDMAYDQNFVNFGKYCWEINRELRGQCSLFREPWFNYYFSFDLREAINSAINTIDSANLIGINIDQIIANPVFTSAFILCAVIAFIVYQRDLKIDEAMTLLLG